MNKKEMMLAFFRKIKYRKLMTKFLVNIFDYDGLNDYNYINRIQDNNDNIVIDIFDNISINRFNRYIFSFNLNDLEYQVSEKDSVFVSVISVIKANDCNNKLLKLAYLFKIDNDKMIDYANSFLDMEFVKIIKGIIK